jgi:TonB-dependent starch-binding outer membrane protein SusC
VFRALPWVRSLAALALPAALSAQTTSVVTGTVRDAGTNQPIVGAAVTVVGTSLGTLTNDRGVYRIERVRTGAATISAQYLGYQRLTRAITVAGAGSTLTQDFALARVALQLDATVITGLPTQTTAREQGAARGLVSAETFAQRPTAPIDQTVQGRVPGVEVFSTDGSPGGGLRFRIRGPNSINGSPEPLVIIDGVIAHNGNRNGQTGQTQVPGFGVNDGSQAFQGLNPEDIASMEILKGAAAAALYGSRASNGAIVIKTKTGRAGQTAFTGSIATGTQELTRGPENIKMDWSPTEIQQWADLVNPGRFVTARYTAAQIQQFGQNPRRNWLVDDPFRSAQFVRYSLGASGGNQGLTYSVSGSDASTEGIMRGTGFRAQNFKLGLDIVPNDKLLINVTTNISRTTRDQLSASGSPLNPLDWYGGSIAMPFMADPRVDFRAPTVFPTQAFGVNYDALWNVRRKSDNQRFLVGTTATYNVTSNLNVTATAGVDYSNEDGRNIFPFAWNTFINPNGRLDVDKVGIFQGNLNLGVNHALTVGSDWTFKTTAGSQFEERRRQYNSIRLQDLSIPTAADDRANNYVTRADQRDVFADQRTLGLYVNETVGFRDKLFVGAGVRADRGSAFRQQTFMYPRGSVSYVVNKDLRVRAAVGTAGTQPVPYQVTPLWAADPRGYGGGAVVRALTPGNADLRPERQIETEGGFDWSLKGGRIVLEGSYYNKSITDLLLSSPVNPAITGNGLALNLLNVGSMYNRGLELGLTTKNLVRSRFEWTTVTSLTTLDNKVTSLLVDNITDNSVAGVGASSGFAGVPRVRTGYPLSGFWGFTTTSPTVEQYLGSPLPKLEASLVNDFVFFKDLSLSVLFNGKFGHKRFSWVDRTLSNANWRLHKERWNLPTADLNAGNTQMDLWVGDADFVRLRNVVLTYQVPTRFTRNLGARSLQLQLSGNNLGVWTKYRGGYDPENETSGFNESGNWVRGIDFWQSGPPRTFSFALNIGM